MKTALVAIVLVVAVGAQAQGVINVDFQPDGDVTYDPPTDGGPYPGATVTDTWNGFELGAATWLPGGGDALSNVTSAPLVESDGTATITTVTVNGGETSNQGGATPWAVALYDDVWHGRYDFNMTYSIDNLAPGGLYDIYFYSGAGQWAGYAATITIDGVGAKGVAYTAPSAWVEDDNYVLFSDVLAVGGTISGTVLPPSVGYDDEAYVNGLTIVGDFIPEPATMTLLGLGGLGVVLRRRRRS